MAWIANGSTYLSAPFAWTQYSGPLTILLWSKLPVPPGSMLAGVAGSGTVASLLLGYSGLSSSTARFDAWDEDHGGNVADSAGPTLSQTTTAGWCCSVVRSYGASQRDIWTNGSQGTVATATNGSPGAFDTLALGANPTGPGLYALLASGDLLAECAIWNVALSDDECVALAEGVAASSIQPSALLGYWPLRANLASASGTSTSLAATGAATFATDHPPVGSLALTTGVGEVLVAGAQPSVQLSTSALTITPGAGAVALHGWPASVEADESGVLVITAGVGAVVIGGAPPSLGSSGVPTVLTPGPDTLTATGFAPSYQMAGAAAVTLGTGAGAIHIAGGVPPVIAAGIAPVTLTTGRGTVTLAGGVTIVLRAGVGGVELLPGADALRFVGKAPSASYATSFTPGAGSVQVAGYAPSVGLTAGVTITPGAGSLLARGAAPGISLSNAGNITLAPLAGAVTLRGQAPSVNNGGNFIQTIGTTLVFTGLAPTFFAPTTILTPGAGAITITGYASSLGAVAPVTLLTGPGALRIQGLPSSLGNQPQSVEIDTQGGAILILGGVGGVNVYDEITVDLWNSDAEAELEYDELYPQERYGVLA